MQERTSSDVVTGRVDVGYPEDRDEAERRLQEKEDAGDHYRSRIAG